MLFVGDHFPVEKYSSYKNRTFARQVKRMDDSLRQIKDCSLKPEDKKKLKQQLIEQINKSL